MPKFREKIISTLEIIKKTRNSFTTQDVINFGEKSKPSWKEVIEFPPRINIKEKDRILKMRISPQLHEIKKSEKYTYLGLDFEPGHTIKWKFKPFEINEIEFFKDFEIMINLPSTGFIYGGLFDLLGGKSLIIPINLNTIVAAKRNGNGNFEIHDQITGEVITNNDSEGRLLNWLINCRTYLHDKDWINYFGRNRTDSQKYFDSLKNYDYKITVEAPHSFRLGQSCVVGTAMASINFIEQESKEFQFDNKEKGDVLKPIWDLLIPNEGGKLIDILKDNWGSSSKQQELLKTFIRLARDYESVIHTNNQKNVYFESLDVGLFDCSSGGGTLSSILGRPILLQLKHETNEIDFDETEVLPEINNKDFGILKSYKGARQTIDTFDIFNKYLKNTQERFENYDDFKKNMITFSSYIAKEASNTIKMKKIDLNKIKTLSKAQCFLYDLPNLIGEDIKNLIDKIENENVAINPIGSGTNSCIIFGENIHKNDKILNEIKKCDMNLIKPYRSNQNLLKVTPLSFKRIKKNKS